MTFSFMGRLTDRYRVTAFDRPGQGYTDRARPGLDGPWAGDAESPSEQAAMLREAASALGIERPIVLGHSYAGSVALAWGLDDPEGTAAVVNVSGASMPWPEAWAASTASTPRGSAAPSRRPSSRPSRPSGWSSGRWRPPSPPTRRPRATRSTWARASPCAARPSAPTRGR
jgi:pimeloyl-ACP methyl ester carboxylesterase